MNRRLYPTDNYGSLLISQQFWLSDSDLTMSCDLEYPDDFWIACVDLRVSHLEHDTPHYYTIINRLSSAENYRSLRISHYRSLLSHRVKNHVLSKTKP
jgi:hypothetical protein